MVPQEGWKDKVAAHPQTARQGKGGRDTLASLAVAVPGKALTETMPWRAIFSPSTSKKYDMSTAYFTCGSKFAVLRSMRPSGSK